MRLPHALRTIALAVAASAALTAQAAAQPGADGLIRTAPAAPVYLGVQPAAPAESGTVFTAPLAAGVLVPAPAPTLPADVLELAAVYRGYVVGAAAVPTAFTAPADIDAAVRAAASYNEFQLLAGAVALAALAALQDPQFVATFRQYARADDYSAQIISGMLTNPEYLAGFPGLDQAAALASAALRSEADQLVASGRTLKQMAYDIQAQPWSREVVSMEEVAAKLASARSLGAQPLGANPEHRAALAAFAAAGGAVGDHGAAPMAQPYSPLVSRALILAAIIAMEKGDATAPQRTQIVSEPRAAFCLSMAKLDFHQCLGSVHQRFDDLYCLSEHGFIDAGDCTSGAGAVQTAAS